MSFERWRDDPGVHLAAAFACVTLIAFAADLNVLLVLAGVALVCTAALPIRRRLFVRRTAAAAPLILLLALGIPWSRGWTDGWAMAATALLRAILSVWVLALLLETTTAPRLLAGLRRLHFPRILVWTLGTMLRYLDLFVQENLTLARARRARTFVCPGRLAFCRRQAELVGKVFVRSLDRAERVHAAMIARGFDGEIRLLDDARKPVAKKSKAPHA